MQHYELVKRPGAQHTHFQAVAAFAVAVVDGPLLYYTQNGEELVMAPWVRLSRHEYVDSDTPVYRDGLFVIDVVHANFFEPYVAEFIEPFAARFQGNVRRQATVLANGEGYLPRLGHNDQFFLEHAVANASDC
jgi:hypothetical protein